MAQQLFQEKQVGSSPRQFPASSHLRPHWPFIEKLVSQGKVNYIDYTIAERFLRPYLRHESVAAVLCFLSLAVRAGHVCVKISSKGIFPSPMDCWQEDESGQVPFEDGKENESFSNLIKEGIALIPSELISDVSGVTELPNRPICRNQDLFYFQRYWVDETRCRQQLQYLLSSAPAVEFDSDLIQQKLSQENLLDEQKQAINAVFSHRLTVISGGPGTGKTYTAGVLIRLYWEALPKEEKNRCRIAIAAPTGKAVANLQTSLSKAFNDIQEMPNFEPQTLHRLLKIRASSQSLEPTHLSSDLLIIDESSMIDLHVMASLLESLKVGSRLVLLGDSFQLPPISCGAMFTEISKSLTGVLNVNQVPSVHYLKTCLRTDLKEIIEIAESIKNGDEKSVIQKLSRESASLIWKQEFDPKKSIHDLLSYFEIAQETTPEQYFYAMNQFRILSPVRKGPFGVDTLNEWIAKSNSIKAEAKGMPFISPIMLTASDSRLELVKGEMAVLVRHNPAVEHILEEDYALLLNRKTNDLQKIPASLLPQYEYAYCLSVHKSQGSEFDRILILMPEGAEKFGKEMLYTAVTRARKGIEVWGQEKTIKATLSKNTNRLSGLRA